MIGGKFADGLKSFVSSLLNQRTAETENYIAATRIHDSEARAIYKTGLGNKIIRLKAGYALNDTLQFDSVADAEFYRLRLAKLVRQVVRWQLAFGRGIVVLHGRSDNLAQPLGPIDPDTVQIRVFSGDMVTVNMADTDLMSPRYMMPRQYNVRGYPVHYSRVVDFRYIIPPELEAPTYRYGGVSEFELIYEQLVADGVVQRASPRIIEKASTLFYKVAGFKEAMSTNVESDMVRYFQQLESLRGIFSAGLIDKEDEVEPVTQAITNLADADQITLRRLAMVTGIPLAALIGENVKGLNSTGDNERQMLQDMIEALQEDYLADPINTLMRKLGKGAVEFKDNQGETPSTRIEYDTKAIANAKALWEMGEDHREYLEDKGVVAPDDFDKMFSTDNSEDEATALLGEMLQGQPDGKA